MIGKCVTRRWHTDKACYHSEDGWNQLDTVVAKVFSASKDLARKNENTECALSRLTRPDQLVSQQKTQIRHKPRSKMENNLLRDHFEVEETPK